MTDIIKRLRERAVTHWAHATGAPPESRGLAPDALCHEAADEIERLTAGDAKMPPVAMNAAEWAELYRLREAVKGPDGYATWQDAATAERLQRVLAERDAQADVEQRDARVAALEGENLDLRTAVRSLETRIDGPALARVNANWPEAT